jgi:hypothetical protein
VAVEVKGGMDLVAAEVEEDLVAVEIEGGI